MLYDIELPDFLEKIKGLLLSVLNIDDLGFELAMDTKLISGLGTNNLALSSIDYVDFLVCIENEYNIVFDFNVRIYTVRDIYDYIIAYKTQERSEMNE